MTAVQLKFMRSLVAAVLGGVAAFAVLTENPAVLLIAVVVAMLVLFVFNRATREVTRDERTALNYARASRAAMATVLPLASVASVALVMFRDRLSHDAVIVAYTLAYFCCAMLLAHSAFYWWYERRG